MPELPDVEHFKRYLMKTSVNKKIIKIECLAKNLIKKITFDNFKKRLIGKSFKVAKRRGKFLIIEIKEIPEKLVIHFAMTGDLHYVKQGAREDRFSRLIFKFANGYELRWLNMRKLGKIYLVKDLNQIKLIKEMGPEPLYLSLNEFSKLLKKHKEKNIKAFLSDQRIIAGIGNVYSDEILFWAKINPHRKIKTLNEKERKRLYKEMKKILNQAVKLTPFWQYPQSWLLFHRSKNLICPRNKNHQLKREVIAGRSAIFCPICQSG